MNDIQQQFYEYTQAVMYMVNPPMFETWLQQQKDAEDALQALVDISQELGAYGGSTE